MSPAVAVLVEHRYAVLFGYVLVSQLGAPLPSPPLLVAAGALAATDRLGMGQALGTVVVACLLADSAWYCLGRTRGGNVLRFLCRISLEPETCVRNAEDGIARYGALFLLGSKFFPGLGLLAAPTAGQSKLSYASFLAFDAAGAVVWAATYIFLGRFLGSTLEHNERLFHLTARFAVLAFAGAIVALLVGRLVRRSRFRRRFATLRITPAELKKRMDRGEAVYVVDLRHPRNVAADGRSFPGSVHLTPQQVIARREQIPTDRDIVVFCNCPREAAAAQVAVRLRHFGFAHVYPLEGGLDAWQRAGYPVDVPSFT
ncbi:MAG TPA: VTT domain-containing protein [Polyangiaceae bacterium]|jgi:membrane protein DedA with SNARE-associated domain/rhodanese-related sulfurtransferase|nr:VTT domain-containing protein [Polyangiaceae bacterium]